MDSEVERMREVRWMRRSRASGSSSESSLGGRTSCTDERRGPGSVWSCLVRLSSRSALVIAGTGEGESYAGGVGSE